jgi:anhydro-N-acetylmuramic acid kinase
LIVTGGGAKNRTLMRMIKSELPDVEVVTAADIGVDGDAVEAVAFAILGYQMLRGRQGNIPSVTGARAPAILGKLTLPPTPLK